MGGWFEDFFFPCPLLRDTNQDRKMFEFLWTMKSLWDHCSVIGPMKCPIARLLKPPAPKSFYLITVIFFTLLVFRVLELIDMEPKNTFIYKRRESPGWFQTPYVTKNDLGLPTSGLHLPSAWSIGTRHRTFSVWCPGSNPGLHSR